MEDPVNNKKYSAILEASRKLFWKHGFRRVTIEEVCREAKTSKMTFYRFFPDKSELAKKVLDQFYDESMLNFRSIIREKSTATVKMRKMIEMKLEGSTDISNEFIKDFLFSKDPSLSSYFEKKLQLIYSEGIREFKNGQEEGWIRKDLNVEFLFYFNQKILPLITDDETLKLFNSPQDMIAEISNLIIYGIAPRE
jgi:AcrR family transcriptional regulator